MQFSLVLPFLLAANLVAALPVNGGDNKNPSHEKRFLGGAIVGGVLVHEHDKHKYQKQEVKDLSRARAEGILEGKAEAEANAKGKSHN